MGFKLGILVGRFQSLHLGHEEIINRAIEICDRVAIFIGSSNEENTAKNPFSYEERKEFLQMVFGDRVEVYPLPDMGLGNVPAWGDYVLDSAKRWCGEEPDLFVSGKEERRASWFNNENSLAELTIPKTIDISASQLRKWMLEGDFAQWSKFVSPCLHSQFDFMRDRIIQTVANDETTSI